MSTKLTIVEGNSNDKDNVRAIMVKGETGYSAYEIAVQHGYTGTEEEWANSFLNADNFYNKSEVDAISNNLEENITELGTELSGSIASNVENLSGAIRGEEATRQDADNNLQSQIDGLASGSPLTASSTSGMTDTSRIYVNTTDGYWYYYNGTNWEAGGVYQSTGISDLSIGYSKIKNDINIDNNFINSKINWTDGAICSENNTDHSEGDIITDSDYKMSEPILLKKGMIMIVDTSIPSSYNDISKVTSSGSFISTISIGAGRKTHWYKATDDIEYVCICRNYNAQCYISIYEDGYFEPKNKETIPINIGSYVASSSNTSYSEGTMPQSTHPWSSTPINDKYIRSNFIRLKAGNILKVNASTPTTINVISIFDNNLNYVSGIKGRNTQHFHDINYISNEDCYVIVSNDISKCANYSVYFYEDAEHYIQNEIEWCQFYVLNNVITVTGTTDYFTTNEIFLRKGDALEYYSYSASDNCYKLSFWVNGVNTGGIIQNNGDSQSSTSSYYVKSRRGTYVATENCFVRVTNRVSTVSNANTEINIKRYDEIKDVNIYNKIVSVIGDSYVANQNNNIGQTWHSKLSCEYGAMYNNYGINGNGLVSTDGSGTPVVNRLDVIDENSDLVIVIGGKNDYNQQLNLNDFKAGIDSICQDLITSFYNKKIVFFTPWNSYGTNDTREIKLEDYVNAIKEECSKYSIPVYDSFHDSNMYMWDTNFRTAFCQSSTDMSHLNKAGHRRFLNQAEKFILNL